MKLSTTEIANVASTYYLITSSFHIHSLVREMIWWWLVLSRKNLCWWLASFGESYHGDVLQYTKQLFSLRLPQMTKYCVMRECDNIHSWISLSGDLAFSHQDGIYGFKFPQKFLEISSRDLTLFSIYSSKDLTNPLVPFSFAFTRLNALQAAVRHSHTPFPGLPSFNLKLHSLPPKLSTLLCHRRYSPSFQS